jgi:hypothetical protein
LDVTHRTMDPGTGIGTPGKVVGLAYPTSPAAGAISAAPSIHSYYYTLRATGPIPAGPYLESGRIIVDPRELGLPREIYRRP